MTVTILILVGYFVLMLAIGWIASRRIRDSRDYFLGGKGFGPWLTAFKFASTWESGVKLVGAPGMAWNVGWAGFSMGIATPICYFFSFRVFGQRLKVAFDHFNVLTLPQLLEKRYQSRTVRILAAAAIVIGLGGSLVAQFKATGEIFSVTLETSYLNGLFLGAGIVGVYCILGGYLASVWTDCLQGVLMIIGSIVIMVATATVAFGGLHWNFIPELNLSLAAIDPNLLDITGGGKIPVTQIVIIVVITGLVGLALPQQSVAIFSMRDVRTARTALVICTFFSAMYCRTMPYIRPWNVPGRIRYVSSPATPIFCAAPCQACICSMKRRMSWNCQKAATITKVLKNVPASVWSVGSPQWVVKWAAVTAIWQPSARFLRSLVCLVRSGAS